MNRIHPRYCLLLMWALGCILPWVLPAAGHAQIQIEVTTILAGQAGPAAIDPQLSPFVNELRSVFRYNTYRALGTHRMHLAVNQTGTATLPGNRVLKVTPLGIQGNRMDMSLEIAKKRQSIFSTRVRLRNRSDIFVGGPEHQGGVLLFRIYNAF